MEKARRTEGVNNGKGAYKVLEAGGCYHMMPLLQMTYTRMMIRNSSPQLHVQKKHDLRQPGCECVCEY